MKKSFVFRFWGEPVWRAFRSPSHFTSEDQRDRHFETLGFVGAVCAISGGALLLLMVPSAHPIIQSVLDSFVATFKTSWLVGLALLIIGRYLVELVAILWITWFVWVIAIAGALLLRPRQFFREGFYPPGDSCLESPKTH